MQTVFFVEFLLGGAYFLLCKRRFDWFAVAFFSACIYFLPGFFGYTSYLATTRWVETPINSTAYGIMSFVGGAISVGGFLYDRSKAERRLPVRDNAPIPDLYIYLLLFFASAGLAIMFLTTGSVLFDPDKAYMMQELNRWHILFYTATMLGGVMAFSSKKWAIFACFCLLTGFDVYIGFRTTLAIIGVGVLTLWLGEHGEIRLLVAFRKQFWFALLLIVFLLLYHQVAFAIKYQDAELLKSLLSNPDTYSSMFVESEGFITQEILNEVTATNFTVGFSHFTGVLAEFVLFGKELGLSAASFNDLFQPALFPDVLYGMANNIWAEMWSTGGWPLLTIFIISFVYALKALSDLFFTKGKTIQALITVLAGYWAFYIHRNDLAYEVDLEKQVLLVFGVCWVVVKLLPRKISDRTVQSG